MASARYPLLYEIPTRVWLGEIGQGLGRPATFDDVPDAALKRIAARGFDWLWLLGVWQTGPAGRAEALKLQADYRAALPDLTEADVAGSPFAVQSYAVHADFGGNESLLRLRLRLRELGLRLMLDFVPNHTALDHPWVFAHPEFYVNATDGDLARWPGNYVRLPTQLGPRVLAHGRDPYFPGWTDTLQLNYRHAGLRDAMTELLITVAGLCDGVRCDMAMLVEPDVFRRTWGDKAAPADGTPPVDEPFWPGAIARVHRRWPDFAFMAEVYWEMEWTLQQEGFDETYDKKLYDALRARDAGAARARLWADLDFQRKSVRFLENHDEARAAAAFPPDVHKAAAVLTYLVPGLRFFFDGQLEGRKIKLPVQLARRPAEQPDPALQDFYPRLLEVLRRPAPRDGRWQLLACAPAWAGNPSDGQFVACLWEERVPLNAARPAGAERLLVAVNYGGNPGQCYVRLPLADLRGRRWLLRDLLGPAQYERDGNDLSQRGLYLDLPAWGYHAFTLTPV